MIHLDQYSPAPEQAPRLRPQDPPQDTPSFGGSAPVPGFAHLANGIPENRPPACNPQEQAQAKKCHLF